MGIGSAAEGVKAVCRDQGHARGWGRVGAAYSHRRFASRSAAPLFKFLKVRATWLSRAFSLLITLGASTR